MLERAIIDHASPTLARLKLGNLFNHPMGEGFPSEFDALRRLLQSRGVTMTVLKIAHGKALIYIYRSEELEKVLVNDGERESEDIKCPPDWPAAYWQESFGKYNYHIEQAQWRLYNLTGWAF